MKSLTLFLILALALILLPVLEAKKSSLSLKSKAKHKSHKSFTKQDFPKTLGQLKQQAFPIPLVDQNTSIIEDVSKNFNIFELNAKILYIKGSSAIFFNESPICRAKSSPHT
jgi:hypothetical protein